MPRALLLAALVIVLIGVLGHRFRHSSVIVQTPSSEEVESAGVEPLALSQARYEDSDDGRRYYVRNLIQGPIELEVSMEHADNVFSDPVLPYRLVLSAKAERQVAVIRRIDAKHEASVTLNYRAMLGSPRAHHALDASYRIPFYAGTQFSIEQGFGGKFSHTDKESHYAIDFGVPLDTPVTAAREGTVMQVEEEFRGHGLTLERYGSRANYVRILHADGSMAVYAHLKPHSTIVDAGQYVAAGALLGKSGNTGYSTGPHLHFAVQINTGMALESVPFSMAGVIENAQH